MMARFRKLDSECCSDLTANTLTGVLAEFIGTLTSLYYVCVVCRTRFA